MKKITLLLVLLATSLSIAQPAGYGWIAEFDGAYANTRVFNLNSPVSNIHSLSVQSTTSDDEFVIEWNSFANKWQNTGISLNSEMTLFHGDINSPNSVINGGTTSGKYYTTQIEGLSYTDRNAVIMETSNAPIIFDGTTPVSAIPTLYPGEDLSLTITFSGAKSSEEKAFIRYSDDGYTTSFVSEVTFGSPNATSGTGIIPGSFNSAGKAVSFYVYTTTVAATDSSNHDLITLNLANNGGSNYSYSVEPYTPGDIAFVGFNADGDKDFAIVTLADISANSTIYFSDNESDGSGGLTTGEGTITWATGTSIIKAGTVIVFTDLDSDLNPNFGSSIGNIIRSGSFNIGASKDGLLAFNGSDASTPTSFIAALQIGNEPAELGSFDGDGITLTNTDLVIGTSILVVDNTASPDGGAYTGSKSSQSSYSDYYSLLSDNSTNWSTSTTDGESLLPFSQEAFTINSTNWTGSVSSVWNLAGNWDNGIPTTSSLATIPDVTTPPIISSGTEALAGNIVINSGENLTVNSSNSLTVTGLLISESGSSLIVNGTLSGTLKYNRTLGTSNWYLVSSPVVGQDVDDFVTASGLETGSGSNLGLGSYNTLDDTWSYYQDLTSNSDTFTEGHGYTVNLLSGSGGTISFTGTMNTADESIGLTTTGNGFNLLGNPYPSYINSATLLTTSTGSLLTETMWIWDQSANSGAGGYITYLTADAFQLAPGQGFFVQSNGAAGNVAINESFQSHQSTDTFLRSATRPEVYLTLSDGSNTRDCKLYYIDGTTTGFDNGYDGPMFGGVSNSFAIYTHAVANGQGRDLAIQSLPDNDYENLIVPIGINAASGTEITISASFVNLPAGIDMYIEDKDTNTFTLLDIASDFTTTLTGDLSGIGRFYLHTTSSALSVNDNSLSYNLQIYTTTSPKELIVKGKLTGTTKAVLYDLQGRLILSNKLDRYNTKNTIDISSLSTGIYVVKVDSDIQIKTQKVIIK